MVAEDRSDEGGDPPCRAQLEHLDEGSVAGRVVFGPTERARESATSPTQSSSATRGHRRSVPVQ